METYTDSEPSPRRRKNSSKQTTPPPKAPDCPLSEIAEGIVMATEGDTVRGATKLLKVLLDKHPDFYAYQAERAMTSWAQRIIGGARHALRNQIARAPLDSTMASKPPPRGAMSKPQQALSQESLKAAAASWFDWVVVPGVMLRNATRVDLLKAAEKYLGDANVYTRRGKWLSAIAEALPDDRTRVADALNEKKVAALAKKFNVSTP